MTAMLNPYYQVNILTPGGQYIDTIEEPNNISAARSVNKVGAFSLEVPYKYWKYAQRDLQFEILRFLGGGQVQIFGNTRWFARKFVRTGRRQPFTASGFDANDFLRRVAVQYASGTSQASKSGLADNTIKEIGTENLIYNGATTPPRGFKNFQIQPNTGLGASLPPKGFERRLLLDIFQELAAASLEAGTYLAFDIQLVGGVFELQTFAVSRGRDRREGIAPNPLILSEELGNLVNIKRVDDYTNEATIMYAGGSGTGAGRLIGFDYDQDRIYATDNNYNAIEGWMDARNLSVQTSLDSEASAGLSARKPRRTMEGTLQENETTRMGVHFDLGDLGTAKYDDESFTVRLDSIGMNWSRKKETISASLQGEF